MRSHPGTNSRLKSYSESHTGLTLFVVWAACRKLTVNSSKSKADIFSNNRDIKYRRFLRGADNDGDARGTINAMLSKQL